MKKLLVTTGRVVTMDPAGRILNGGGLVIDGDRIADVLSADALSARQDFRDEVIDFGDHTIIPGFIQTHLHLCQTLFRGLADDLELLDWLRLRIYPFEAAHTPRSMHASAMLGIAELIRSGTTTMMDMGSLRHEEEIVRAIEETGIRAFVGKALMDRNGVLPSFCEPTGDALDAALREAEQWHGAANGRIRYAVAPRFVLSCTDDLLREAYAMTRSFPGMLFHTHAAENRREMEAVRARCGMQNIEFFDALEILHDNTCLAHCIWVTDSEIALLHGHRTNVLHCPSSNLKLGSGVARVPEYLASGITVSLGADGAPCNNTLDMFQEMRIAALVQKPRLGPTTMTAAQVFAMATTGGARALSLEAEVGSLEPGKKADIVVLDLERLWNPGATSEPGDVYSSIVYSSCPENVDSVMVDGRWLYRNRRFTTLNDRLVRHAARREREELLGRVETSATDIL